MGGLIDRRGGLIDRMGGLIDRKESSQLIEHRRLVGPQIIY